MNRTPAIQALSATKPTHVATVARFQIYQQTREGVYATAFKTDSAVEAVGVFLRQSPAFEGGEVRLWDNREQHLSAWVRWNVGGTDGRENVFQDRLLAVVARQFRSREEIRQDRRQSVSMGA